MRTHWREFVFVGILGGFTTFSTFGLDTITVGSLGLAAPFRLVAVERFGVIAKPPGGSPLSE